MTLASYVSRKKSGKKDFGGEKLWIALKFIVRPSCGYTLFHFIVINKLASIGKIVRFGSVRFGSVRRFSSGPG